MLVASKICGPVDTRFVVCTRALHIILTLFGCGAAVDRLAPALSDWCVCLGAAVDGWAVDLYLRSTGSGREWVLDTHISICQLKYTRLAV